MCENLLNSTGVKVLYLSYENLYIAFAKKLLSAGVMITRELWRQMFSN